MSAKRLRRLFAYVAIGAVAYGQFAVAGHACPLQGIPPAVATTHGSAHEAERSGPCAGMDRAPADAQGKGCETHCTDGIVVAAQPDLSPAAFAALPAPTIAVAELRVGDGCLSAALVPVSRAPPLILQFCRLLI